MATRTSAAQCAGSDPIDQTPVRSVHAGPKDSTARCQCRCRDRGAGTKPRIKKIPLGKRHCVPALWGNPSVHARALRFAHRMATRTSTTWRARSGVWRIGPDRALVATGSAKSGGFDGSLPMPVPVPGSGCGDEAPHKETPVGETARRPAHWHNPSVHARSSAQSTAWHPEHRRDASAGSNRKVGR